MTLSVLRRNGGYTVHESRWWGGWYWAGCGCCSYMPRLWPVYNLTEGEAGSMVERVKAQRAPRGDGKVEVVMRVEV